MGDQSPDGLLYVQASSDQHHVALGADAALLVAHRRLTNR